MDQDQIRNLRESVCTKHIQTLHHSFNLHNQLIETRRQASENTVDPENFLREAQLIVISREILAECIKHSLETQLNLIDASFAENQNEQPIQDNPNEE